MFASRDFLSGLMFAAAGVFVVVTAGHYRMGSLQSMGPGFFPTALGTLIAGLGTLIAFRAIVRPSASQTAVDWQLKPLLLILAGVVGFGLLVERLGLILSMIPLVAASRIALGEGSIRETVLIGVTMAAVAAVVFVYAFGMPLSLLPR